MVTALTERGGERAREWPSPSGQGETGSGVSHLPAVTAPRSVSALDACHAARHAWQRTQPQYAIDLWGDSPDSPDSIRGHSHGGRPCDTVGNGTVRPAALDLSHPGALNARPGPETARGPHAPISPPGSSVEGTADDGRKGNCGPAVPSLTTKQGASRSTDAPEARSREEAMNEPTKVGVEVETPKPEAPQPAPETQTTEVEVETPEGQPDVEVEVETPKPA